MCHIVILFKLHSTAPIKNHNEKTQIKATKPEDLKANLHCI